MMEYNRAELKRSVKRSMKGSGCMMVTLLFTVVVSAGTWLINTVLGWLTPGQLGLSTMISFHLQAGYELEEAVKQAILTLDMARDSHPPVSRIFCALPRLGPVVVTRFLTGLFELLWSLLVGVGYIVLVVIIAVVGTATELMGLTIVLLLAAFVGFMLAAIWVTMRYALVDYVLLDKGLSGLDAIRESKRLMKDNIGRGWVLQVSFFGWYLLMIGMIYVGAFLALFPIIGMYVSGGGTGGWVAASGFALVVLIAVAIGSTVLSLWLKPYVTGAMAKFYDWADGRPDDPWN